MKQPAFLQKHGGELTLAAAVLAVVAMIVVPLPTPLIDVLISLNLASGVVLLSAVLFARDALTFSAFPTLLLLSTLLRLALNVSSSRLILLDADAGRIIAAFGHVVVRGDFAVGALLFVVITLVQLIVVIKGAERVAEVSARFNLDALPGRQLAIDAELRAGVLSHAEARGERQRLADESQLLGALDGAMKLVRGDALAGLIIAFVNLLGGAAIGVLQRGLSLTESVSTYGVLTIGDGLVTQIPSMLSATAAGLIVTRARSAQSLFQQLEAQLFGDARAVWSASAVLFALSWVPGLPAWPLCLVAALCAGFALRLSRRRPSPLVPPEQASERLVVVLSARLCAALGSGAVTALSAHLERVRTATMASLGFAGAPLALCVDPALELQEVALWLDGGELQRVRLASARQDAVSSELSERIAQLVRAHAPELLTLDEVSALGRALELRAPALARLAFPKHLPLLRLHQLARRLLEEGLSLRPFEEIVQAALHADPDAPLDDVVERVRTALRRRLSAQVAPSGRLHVLRLSSEVVEALEDALFDDAGRPTLALEPALGAEIRAAIARAAANAQGPRALLVDARLRRHVVELIAGLRGSLAVLKPSELAPELEITETTLISP